MFVVVALIMGGQVVEQKDISTVDTFSGESQQAERALTDAGLRPNEEVVLIQNEKSSATDACVPGRGGRDRGELRATEHVTNVATPYDGDGGAISEDGHSVLVDFEITGPDVDAGVNVRRERGRRRRPSQTANPAVQRRAVRLGLVGQEPATRRSPSDLGKAGMLSLPLTLLILAVALGGMVAAGVPLLLALTGVIATMALVAIPSQVFPLDGNVGALILLIGLAVGVDYSLFYMRREREERAKGMSPQESLQAAARTSGRAVMISGLTVMIAMSGMFITGEATFESFAVATVSVVAIEMFVSLVVLPAVLAWLGDRVDKGRFPLRKRYAAARRASRGSGARSSRASCAGPLLSAVLATAALLALAIPGLSMNTTQTGIDDLPQDLAVIQTYNHYTDAFPDEGERQRGRRQGRRRAQRRGRRVDRRAGRRGRPVGHVHRLRRRSPTARTERSPRSVCRARATEPTRRRSPPSRRSATSSSRPRSGRSTERRRASPEAPRAPRTSTRSSATACRWCSSSSSAWRSC